MQARLFWKATYSDSKVVLGKSWDHSMGPFNSFCIPDMTPDSFFVVMRNLETQEYKVNDAKVTNWPAEKIKFGTPISDC